MFKANNPTSNQTVALKTVCLDIPEDQAKEFVERVLAEGEHTRELNSQNLALLYGAGQIEDQFCAAMEYVQGNSIATHARPPTKAFRFGIYSTSAARCVQDSIMPARLASSTTASNPRRSWCSGTAW